MCQIKCLSCETEFEEEIILNCPIYGTICPICGVVLDSVEGLKVTEILN